MNGELPDEAWLFALMKLPEVGPARLQALLGGGAAREAWDRVIAGAVGPIPRVGDDRVASWSVAARRFDVPAQWAAMGSLGIQCLTSAHEFFPDHLRQDIEPPAALYALGVAQNGPSVALVGTRACTSYGLRCAFSLGSELAASGVHVVSGLALGIDAAAHQGALSVSGAPPIGVVGSGLDVVYPKRNRQLWAAVAERGWLLSETPPGVGPAPWRFPARNRIIAALADLVVVVESHETGGSLLTVDEAQLRDVEVAAVPGPVGSAASAGTNRLLRDGASVVLDVDDILGLIGVTSPRREAPVVVEEPSLFDQTSDLSDGAASEIASIPTTGTPETRVLTALGWSPASVQDLVRRTSMEPGEVATVVEQLVSSAQCRWSGPWIERCS